MPPPYSGRCLCGAVRYRVAGALADVLYCHCENCRRLTGNFIAASRAAWADVTFTDQRGLRWYELGYARYGFCGDCGATLFFEAADAPERLSIATGTLDDASDLELGGVWFAEEAQRHHQLPDGVPHHTGNG